MSSIGAVVSFGASSDGQYVEHDDLLGRHIVATAASTAGIASLDLECGVSWLWGGVGNPKAVAQWTEMNDVRQVALGGEHALFLKSDGSVYSVGRNSDGQLGLHHMRDVESPEEIRRVRFATSSSGENGAYVVQVAAGQHHSAAITNKGELYMWGRGVEGQLGLGSGRSSCPSHRQMVSTPHFVSFFSPSCPATRNRWYGTDGSHRAHETGVEDSPPGSPTWSSGLGEDSVETPPSASQAMVTQQQALRRGLRSRRVTRVACGAHFTLALSACGAMYAWGEGRCGQLGLGSSKRRDNPGLIARCDPDGQPFVDLAAGWAHGLALTAAGHVYAWGFNGKGQLGLGDTRVRTTPVRIELPPSGENARAVTPAFHTDEPPSRVAGRGVPLTVGRGTPLVAVAIAAGRSHSALLTEDGRVFTCGAAEGGRLGHQTQPDLDHVAKTDGDDEKGDGRKRGEAMRARLAASPGSGQSSPARSLTETGRWDTLHAATEALSDVPAEQLLGTGPLHAPARPIGPFARFHGRDTRKPADATHGRLPPHLTGRIQAGHRDELPESPTVLRRRQNESISADLLNRKIPLDRDIAGVVTVPSQACHALLDARLVSSLTCGPYDTVLFCPAVLRAVEPCCSFLEGGVRVRLEGAGLESLAARVRPDSSEPVPGVSLRVEVVLPDEDDADADDNDATAAAAAGLNQQVSRELLEPQFVPVYAAPLDDVMAERTETGKTWALEAIAPSMSEPCQVRMDLLVEKEVTDSDRGQSEEEEEEEEEEGKVSWEAVRGVASFAYTEAPRITEVSPSLLLLRPGQTMTLSGEKLFGCMLADPHARTAAEWLVHAVEDEEMKREDEEVERMERDEDEEEAAAGFKHEEPFRLSTDEWYARNEGEDNDRHSAWVRFAYVADGQRLGVSDAYQASYLGWFEEQSKQRKGSFGEGDTESKDEEDDSDDDEAPGLRGEFEAAVTLALPDSLGDELSGVLAERAQVELWPEFSPNGVSWVESLNPVRPCAPNFTQVQPELVPHGWSNCPPIAVHGSGWPLDLVELRGQWMDASSGELVEEAGNISVESASCITVAAPTVAGLHAGDSPQVLELALALDGETFLDAGQVTVFAGSWEVASKPLLPRVGGAAVECSLQPVPPVEATDADRQHSQEDDDGRGPEQGGEGEEEVAGEETYDNDAREDERLPSWIPSGVAPVVRLCSTKGDVVWEGEASFDGATGRIGWEVSASVMEDAVGDDRGEQGDDEEAAEGGAGEEKASGPGLVCLDVLLSLDGTVFFPCCEGRDRFFIYDPSRVHVTAVGPKKLGPGATMEVSISGLEALLLERSLYVDVAQPHVRVGNLVLESASLAADEAAQDDGRWTGVVRAELPSIEDGLEAGNTVVEVSLDGGSCFTSDETKAKIGKK